jgi:hypothetical protein
MSLPEPSFEVLPVAVAEPERRPPPPAFSGPISLILAGMIVLGLVGGAEDRWSLEQPWSEAVIAADTSAGLSGIPEGAFPAYVRGVSRVAPTPVDELLDTLHELAQKEGLDLPLNAPERVIAVAVDPQQFAPLLEAGRLPAPGSAEVLAGDLARSEPFELDGERFEVVGQLKRGVSGLVFAYLAAYSPEIAPHFTAAAGATQGWLHPEGLSQLKTLLPDHGPASEDVLGGQTRVPAWCTLSAMLGLLLVAWGGAAVYARLFRCLSDPPTPVLGPVLQETVRRRRLFRGVHVALYGVFFSFMVAGAEFPLLNYRLTEYMRGVFAEGGLSYIGDAYASQNILDAALATYYNNYVVQTLGYTFLISLPPLALGVFKTAASFALVGFAMTPIWAGAATGYMFHSLTMALELEAYILASFVVLVWPLRLWRAVTGGAFGREVFTGLRILLGGAIVTGVMLAAAALYEAVTLIMMGRYL